MLTNQKWIIEIWLSIVFGLKTNPTAAAAAAGGGGGGGGVWLLFVVGVEGKKEKKI